MVDNGHSAASYYTRTRSRLLRMTDRIIKKLSHELRMGGGTWTLFPQSRCYCAPRQFWEQLQVYSLSDPSFKVVMLEFKPWGTVTISSASTQKTPHTLSLLRSSRSRSRTRICISEDDCRQPRLIHIALVHSFIDSGFGTPLTSH